nr:Dihydrofolate reductase [uncultured bacterium]
MISAIVAVANKGVIGKEGDLPWYLPSELARFKAITMGHPIVMGRKTHESIGRALPGRTNIIITRDKKFKAEDCVVCNSLDEALEAAAKSPGSEEIFVIGGESVYSEALPKVGKLYLTKVAASVNGDKFFRYNKSEWNQLSSEAHKADEKNQYAYEFKVLERR